MVKLCAMRVGIEMTFCRVYKYCECVLMHSCFQEKERNKTQSQLDKMAWWYAHSSIFRALSCIFRRARNANSYCLLREAFRRVKQKISDGVDIIKMNANLCGK